MHEHVQYVCMHIYDVCMYVYIYVCQPVKAWVWLHSRKSIEMHTKLDLYLHLNLHLNLNSVLYLDVPDDASASAASENAVTSAGTFPACM